MAIKTSTFSGWRLSGKDAEAFLEQIEKSNPNKQAQETLTRGKKLLRQYDEQGYLVLPANQ